MCPDPQLLSVYFDKELPSPWKEKMEEHLSACTGCRERLAGYEALGPAAEGEDVAAVLEEAKTRVWKNLSRTLSPQQAPKRIRRWRRLDISVPAAVAALVAVALVAALASGPFYPRKGQDQTLADISTGGNGVIPVSDMSGVLKYLDSQSSSPDIVIIQLPESSSFARTGEPALVRAADYVRSVAP